MAEAPMNVDAYVDPRNLNMTHNYDYDPAMCAGKIGPLVNIGWDPDRSFYIQAGGWNMHVGNCRLCFSAGPMNDQCRYCHTKEKPSYYSIIRMRNQVVHPFHLAHSAIKPMDIPITAQEMRDFKYSRPESELENVSVLIFDISLAIYHMKVPRAKGIPQEIQDYVRQLPTVQRNEIFRETCILPDAKSRYFDIVIVRSPIANFFDLQATTMERLINEADTTV